MDLSLDLFSLTRHSNRWLIVFTGSVLMWVAPVSLKAPKLLIFLSFPCSLTGFAFCANTAKEWGKLDSYNEKIDILTTELENHQFALKEEWLKNHLMETYFPVVELMENQGSVDRLKNVVQQVLNPVPTSSDKGSSGSEPFFTIHQLCENEAIAVVKQLIDSGLSKNEILTQLWQVSKGGGKRYAAAKNEYEYLARRGRDGFLGNSN